MVVEAKCVCVGRFWSRPQLKFATLPAETQTYGVLRIVDFSKSCHFQRVRALLLSKSSHLFVLQLRSSSSRFRNPTKAFETICVPAIDGVLCWQSRTPFPCPVRRCLVANSGSARTLIGISRGGTGTGNGTGTEATEWHVTCTPLASWSTSGPFPLLF